MGDEIVFAAATLERLVRHLPHHGHGQARRIADRREDRQLLGRWLHLALRRAAAIDPEHERRPLDGELLGQVHGELMPPRDAPPGLAHELGCEKPPGRKIARGDPRPVGAAVGGLHVVGECGARTAGLRQCGGGSVRGEQRMATRRERCRPQRA